LETDFESEEADREKTDAEAGAAVDLPDGCREHNLGSCGSPKLEPRPNTGRFLIAAAACGAKRIRGLTEEDLRFQVLIGLARSIKPRPTKTTKSDGFSVQIERQVYHPHTSRRTVNTTSYRT
jgi:hypothetical protein